MKSITTNQLFDKLKHKEMLEMSDLVQVIKDEFNVNVWIEEHNDDGLDIESLVCYGQTSVDFDGLHQEFVITNFPFCRSLRGSVSWCYPIIPLLELSVRD